MGYSLDNQSNEGKYDNKIDRKHTKPAVEYLEDRIAHLNVISIKWKDKF
jgi:hypothetical protein